jgi:predicted RND superfamily exporter protein
MEKMFSYILKIRWLIILFVLAATVFFAIQIPRIGINSDVISSLPDNDPNAVLIKKIGVQFGGNKTGMIILEAGNIYTKEVIEHVKQITDTLNEIEGISSITSLTSIMDVKSGEDGMEIGKLIDENDLPDTPEELKMLKQRVLSHENYKGTIVSEDGTSTIIIFSINDDGNMQTLANRVKDKVDALKLPERIYYGGSPMMITSISRLIASDLIRLLPIAFLLITIVLFMGFRSLRGVVLPLLIATISIIWVIGIMSLVGSEMTMVSNNIPIVLLAVGTAYAIHVINRIDQVKGNLDQSIIMALTYVFIPVILAALTTITGFISFIFGSYLTMIRDFGMYSALGTLIALILSLFFIPALISAFAWKGKDTSRHEKEEGNTFFSRYFLLPLQRTLFKNTRLILALWIIMTVINIGGIFLIHRNVDVRNYFRKGNPTRVAEDIMTSKFGGTKPVFVLFKGDIQSPELLNTMLRTEAYMRQNKEIVSTQSIADLIVEINGALGEGRSVPDSREKIEQIWFLLDGNENLQKFVTEDQTEAVIISRFISSENKDKKEFEAYMKSFIEKNSTPGCTIEMTGMPFIESTMDRSLIYSQLGSLLIALLFVVIIVSAILHSFSSGIYAAIPIISTILILFGVMGFSGIPLNIATVLVASVAMGIGIDYSIHVITHFNNSVNTGASIAEALEETIRISGKAIIINFISVSAGFLVLLFSEMVPLQYFGLLICLSMIGSGLSALTFLPVILILAHGNRKSISGNLS